MFTRLAVVTLFISSMGWGLTWMPIKKLSEMGLEGYAVKGAEEISALGGWRVYLSA